MMMEMMRAMGVVGVDMSGMGMIDHVVSRPAHRAENHRRKTNAWNTFVDALRANAKKLAEVRASMMAQPSDGHPAMIVDRLAWQKRWLAARLEGTRASKAASTDLCSALSDDQKKTADELLGPHMGMGMMIMMQGQMQPTQKQRGQMQPGQMQARPDDARPDAARTDAASLIP
jgi:hypothetical protein